MDEEQQQTQTEEAPPETTETPIEPEITEEQPEIVITEIPEPTEEFTTVVTDQGTITVIHSITLGDLLVTSFLFGIMIFMLISRVTKRG